MSRKTEEEVLCEINAIRALQSQLPARARDASEAALRVLVERLSHDDVYDIFDEGTDEFEDANAARLWRDGVSSCKDALSVQYREII